MTMSYIAQQKTSSEIKPLEADDESYRRWRQDLLQNSPPEERLQEWLFHVLHIWLSRYAVCPGHCSQLEYFSDRYYNRVQDTILWAARMWGKSFLAGLEAWMKGRYESYWEANICAGSQAQANRVYKATDFMWTQADDIAGRAVLKRDPLKSLTEFLNGSFYETTTASTRSQRGPHPNALFADEIDEMAIDVFNSAMEQTTTRMGHMASTALLSTMHKVGGLMATWVDNAEEKGYKLYTSCVLETLEGCMDGEYSCSTCNLSEYCQGRLKVVTKQAIEDQIREGWILSGQRPYMGFNTIEEIQRKVRQGYEKEEATGLIKPIDVAAELFCKRPSRIGMVFPEFDENFHVVSAQEISVSNKWKKGRTTDFGFTAPFVDLYFAITPRDQIIFYNEFVQTGMTMDDILNHLKQGSKREVFLHTFADPAGATEIDTIRKAGIRMQGIGGEIQERLNHMRHLFRTNIDSLPSIIISSACKNFIRELKSYRYPDTGLSEVPIKRDDHCIEAAGRGIKGWRDGLLQELSTLLGEVKLGGQRDGRRNEADRAYDEAKKVAKRPTRNVQGSRERRKRPSGVADYL